MSLLLKNVYVLDPYSPAHTQQASILIEKGKITSLNGKSAQKEIDLKGKMVSCGWMDLNAQFCDPGHEHREDIDSGSEVASAGGFTDVCLIPETVPPVTSKSDVSYLIKKAPGYLDIHPIAAVSESLSGENLTEMLDLYNAGAVAFSEGDQSIWNTKLLLKALQYTNDINVPIVQNARDLNLSQGTHIHEGKVSTLLGLRGEPSLSEELIIQRDIDILKYSGGSIHFSRLSTARGVELVKKSKKEGLPVTCDVSIHHLLFSENDIGDFDSIYKNLPPYRSEKDRKSLVKGVKEGTIDAICSNHRPLDQESKQLEFDRADPGCISLQTFCPSLLKIAEEVPLDALIERVVQGPRKIMGMQGTKIDTGEIAKLTIFDPEQTWTLDDASNLSKSRNSPFWNAKLKGNVIGTVNRTNTTIK